MDLNAYGVNEMNSAEMQTTDGGCFLTALIIAAVVIVAVIFAHDGNENTETWVKGEDGEFHRVGV